MKHAPIYFYNKENPHFTEGTEWIAREDYEKTLNFNDKLVEALEKVHDISTAFKDSFGCSKISEIVKQAIADVEGVN